MEVLEKKQCTKCKNEYPLNNFKRIDNGKETKTCSNCRKSTYAAVYKHHRAKSPEEKQEYHNRVKAYSQALTRLKNSNSEEFLMYFEEELSKYELTNKPGKMSP